MDDSSTKIEFYQQCVELTDFVLEGYKNQLQSLTENQDRQKAVLKMYEKDRSEMILALVHKQCFDEAASLAEKYLEFNALVKICEITNDQIKVKNS